MVKKKDEILKTLNQLRIEEEKIRQTILNYITKLRLDINNNDNFNFIIEKVKDFYTKSVEINMKKEINSKIIFFLKKIYIIEELREIKDNKKKLKSKFKK